MPRVRTAHYVSQNVGAAKRESWNCPCWIRTSQASILTKRQHGHSSCSACTPPFVDSRSVTEGRTVPRGHSGLTGYYYSLLTKSDVCTLDHLLQFYLALLRSFFSLSLVRSAPTFGHCRPFYASLYVTARQSIEWPENVSNDSFTLFSRPGDWRPRSRQNLPRTVDSLAGGLSITHRTTVVGA